MVWKGDSIKVFTIRKFYSLLEISCVTPFPLMIIWNSWIPTKMSFFTWEACQGKVFDFGSTSKKRVGVGQQVYLVQGRVKVH